MTIKRTALIASLSGLTLAANPSFAGVYIDNTPTGDAIVGLAEGTSTTGYFTNSSASAQIGESGGSGNRRVSNSVLGFDLPTLGAGEVIDSVTLQFEITEVRADAAELGDLLVTLLDSTAPDLTDFNESASVSGTDEIVGTETTLGLKTLTLTGDALALFIGFYGGDDTPDQAEAFFRLSNTTEIILGGSIDRYKIDYASGAPVATLTVNTVPEPGSLALLGLGGLCLMKRRRRD